MEKQIDVVPYKEEYKEIWNDFVKNSRNGTFLHEREYMDYHNDRFTDCSILLNIENKLVAIFPANVVGNKVFSHQGLTFGGLIVGYAANTISVLAIFQAILDFYKDKGCEEIEYRPVPYIYHEYPCQEDIYALFRHNAQIDSCSISTVIDMQNPYKFSDIRKRQSKKAAKLNIIVQPSVQWQEFWLVLSENLSQKYGAEPVHSVEEIISLYELFNNNIKLFTAIHDNEVIGGVVIFESKKVAHAQYISANDFGKSNGALDAIFDFLINDFYKEKVSYFDFGTSTEQGGVILNSGLISQKEGFGARGVVYDRYVIK